MASRDWFRNEDWSPEIAEAFEARLRRARRKDEYLYLQAITLLQTHPRECLALIERYFGLGERHRDAGARWVQAQAHCGLGDFQAAYLAYEAALEAERLSPGMVTGSCLDYPYLLAMRDEARLFDRALEVLALPQVRLVVPVSRFKFHASRALVFSHRGDREAARAEARLALDAASQSRSGFPDHPGVGLVGELHAPGLARLRPLCDA